MGSYKNIKKIAPVQPHQFYLLLLFSVLFLNCSPLKRYNKDTYAWALPEIAEFERQNATIQYPKDAILFVGSSSIRLWETLEEDMAPYPVIQRGYGGAHLRDAVFFSESLFGKHDLKMIVGFIANDIKGDKDDAKPEQVRRLFKIFIRQLRQRYPSLPVLWVAVTPTKSRWEQWKKIRRVNKKLNTYCQKNQALYFLDTQAEFLNEEGLPKTDLFITDQLHLNQKGYALWNSMIRKEIEKHLN